MGKLNRFKAIIENVMDINPNPSAAFSSIPWKPVNSGLIVTVVDTVATHTTLKIMGNS